MDRTPERPVRAEAVTFDVPTDQNENRSPRRSSRVKKNPSVTPKRFTKFFTPRLRPTKRNVRSSRKALRDLSTSNLNSRPDSNQLPPTKKRKLSFASVTSIPSSPIKKTGLFPSSQESIQVDAKEKETVCLETDDEDGDDLSGTRIFPPRVVPYRSISTSTGLLSRQ